MSRLLRFFQTAPKMRSDRVLELIKDGRAADLMEAIIDERSDPNRIEGHSKNNAVTVRRVGAYARNLNGHSPA